MRKCQNATWRCTGGFKIDWSSAKLSWIWSIFWSGEQRLNLKLPLTYFFFNFFTKLSVLVSLLTVHCAGLWGRQIIFLSWNGCCHVLFKKQLCPSIASKKIINGWVLQLKTCYWCNKCGTNNAFCPSWSHLIDLPSPVNDLKCSIQVHFIYSYELWLLPALYKNVLYCIQKE